MFNKIRDYIPIIVIAILYLVVSFFFDLGNNILTATFCFYIIFALIMNMYLYKVDKENKDNKVQKKLVAKILRCLATVPFFFSLFVMILFPTSNIRFFIFFVLIIVYIVCITLRIISYIKKYKDM